MTFASFEYLVLLVGTFAIYYLLPWRARITMVVIASYVFYAYWEPWYAVIIGFTTIVDYYAALAIQRSETPRSRWWFLLASISVNLGMLAYFKYTNFALDTLRPLLGWAGLDVPILHVMLPVGISFYTFQEMSYTIDVYRRRFTATSDPILFAAYVSFFPQLVAGPIERAEHLMTQLAVLQRFDFARVTSGVALIFVGLAKKLIIADRLTYFAYPKFRNPASFDGLELLFSLIVMSIALYLDFSAYTDMARGSGRMLGIELSRNFDFPGMHTSPADYWQRWHVTLGAWIRDYVFQPLGGASRRAPWRTALNFVVAMALIGLWHGAAWTFVLWGVGQGVGLAVHYVYRIHLRRHHKPSRSAAGFVVAWILSSAYQFLLAALFFAPSVPVALLYWRRLLTPWTSVGDPALNVLVVFLVAFYAVQLVGRHLDYRTAWARLPAPVQGAAFAVLFYAVLFGGVPQAQRFVYFQF